MNRSNHLLRFPRTTLEAFRRHWSEQARAPRVSAGGPIREPLRDRARRFLRKLIWG